MAVSTLNTVLGGPSDFIDRTRPQAARRNPTPQARTIAGSGSARRAARSRRTPKTAYHDAKNRISLSTFGDTLPRLSTPRVPCLYTECSKARGDSSNARQRQAQRPLATHAHSSRLASPPRQDASPPATGVLWRTETDPWTRRNSALVVTLFAAHLAAAGLGDGASRAASCYIPGSPGSRVVRRRANALAARGDRRAAPARAACRP